LLFFKKKQPFLKDLIPNNYIDIHSHLLPSIDDGAKDIEATLFLVNSLKDMGVSEFITTPHIFSGFWDNTKSGIENTTQETITILNNNDLKIPFKAAAEYLLDDHFVSLFKTREILTLKDNHVLVEMSYLNPPIHLYDILFELQVAGYAPVLAHPERYLFYHKNFEQYNKLKNAGCLFQLNLLSTVGYYGTEVAEAAKKLLNQGLIDYVGSDVHHKKHIESFNKSVLLKDLQPLKDAFLNNQFFQ
jgi:protein-tyrosine phosphatase